MALKTNTFKLTRNLVEDINTKLQGFIMQWAKEYYGQIFKFGASANEVRNYFRNVLKEDISAEIALILYYYYITNKAGVKTESRDKFGNNRFYLFWDDRSYKNRLFTDDCTTVENLIKKSPLWKASGFSQDACIEIEVPEGCCNITPADVELYIRAVINKKTETRTSKQLF